jgi:hypothetical protein
MPLDVARGHPARIESDDLLIEAGKATLIFGDQRRLEAPLAIARDRELQSGGIGEHCLRTRAVAHIARCLLILLAEMMIQLGVQNPFRQCLLQLV